MYTEHKWMDAKMKSTKFETAYPISSFFAMLHGYVNTFSPSKAGMIFVKNDRPAEEYLEMARNFAKQGNINDAENIIQRVVDLVTQEEYEEAYDAIARLSMSMELS